MCLSLGSIEVIILFTFLFNIRTISYSYLKNSIALPGNILPIPAPSNE